MSDEKIIKYVKLKGRLFINLGFLLVGITMFIICLKDIIDALVFNKVILDMKGSYTVFLFSVVCLLVSLRSLVSYFGNKIMISKDFLTIKRAVIGRVYKIPLKSIIGKRKVSSSSKGFNNYEIIFYLKSGKKISTGFLNCKDSEIDKIYSDFNFKEIEGSSVHKNKSDFYRTETYDEELFIKANLFFPILSYMLIGVFVTGTILLLSGANSKFGTQQNFKVSADIVNKQIVKNKGQYKFIVLSGDSSEKQEIVVDEHTYSQYEINHKINIYGKKGCLGIVYDLKFVGL